MLGWALAAWFWILCGILMYREWSAETREHSRTALFGLILFGPAIATVKIIGEAFGLVRNRKDDPHA